MMQAKNSGLSSPNQLPGDRPFLLAPTVYAHAVGAVARVGLASARACWPCRNRGPEHKRGVIDAGDRTLEREAAG